MSIGSGTDPMLPERERKHSPSKERDKVKNASSRECLAGATPVYGCGRFSDGAWS